MEEERANTLVERHADTILRIGYTWLGDLDDAKDVCQEVLLKLLLDQRHFPDSGQERAWVVRLDHQPVQKLEEERLVSPPGAAGGGTEPLCGAS